jgi:shikimate kinase
VLDPENRRVMRENGTVVYLRARVEHLWERTRHDTHRPLLATPDPRATLERLLLEREPLYREAAHLVVETGHQGAATILDRVIGALRQRAPGALP